MQSLAQMQILAQGTLQLCIPTLETKVFKIMHNVSTSCIEKKVIAVKLEEKPPFVPESELSLKFWSKTFC